MHTVLGVQRQKGSQNRMVKYIVQSNDTSETIAERFYGYARLGKPLSETNGYKEFLTAAKRLCSTVPGEH